MSDQPSSPRRRLRSSGLALTSLMAGTAMSISACDGSPGATQWGDPPAASREVDAKTFASLADCKSSGDMTAEQCDTAYAQAQKDAAANAPKFGDQQSCEERYGVDQCVPRSSQGGGSFFTPLLTGFIVGQALSNMGGGYRGAPMYRDRDGTYYSGSGYPLSRDYVTGRTRVRSDSFDAPEARAPARVQSRSSVISRGGFGGGGRSFGG
ncbi:putative integral membrane protein [Caulobacter sp. AP07]|uniref:DUF1190 domain-containing protein n=1 Tax=Caulobacter sp. AP07 TaxID=1144304 RepID=UPI000271F2C5|nr:DUF1190 domain-containing protein [Caulobacter sp. AP07]EJL30687.1 putative integral membrane protein [Caulobacter sp. AP07]